MISPLTAIHQAAEYQQHLARLIELVLAPALQSLAAAQAQAQLQQQQLRDLRDTLAIQAAASHQPRQPHEHSPRQHEQQAVYVPGETKASPRDRGGKQAGRYLGVCHLRKIRSFDSDQEYQANEKAGHLPRENA